MKPTGVAPGSPLTGDAGTRRAGFFGVSPPGRVLCCLILVAGLATAPPRAPEALLGALLVSIGVVGVVRPPIARLARRSLLAAPLLLALVLPLLIVGDAWRGLSLTARALSALLTTLAFSTTLDPDELPDALAALGLPKTLVSLVGSMLRQATAVSAQARRIVLARRLRGARGPQVSAEVLASLLAKTAERAERVELAMRLRGARLGGDRKRRPLRMADTPALLICAATSVAIHAVAG